MFEVDIIALLGPLVAGRAFYDSTPDDFVPNQAHIIVQQVGGKAAWYIDQSLPGFKHARLQVWVWANSRLEAGPLARQVEAALAGSSFPVEPYGAAVNGHQKELKLFGSRQDFGVWYPDP